MSWSSVALSVVGTPSCIGRPEMSRAEEIQQEVQEIANVLAEKQGKSPSDVGIWTEALSLWRVRLETEVLPLLEE